MEARAGVEPTYTDLQRIEIENLILNQIVTIIFFGV